MPPPVSHEEILATALEKSTPAEVAGSDRSRNAFRDFVSRARSPERQELLLSHPSNAASQASNLNSVGQPTPDSGPRSSSSSSLSKQSNASKSTSRTSTEGSQATGTSSENELLRSARSFFSVQTTSNSRAEAFVRVIRGLHQAVQHSTETYQSLWQAEGDIFGPSGPGESRLRRLARGRKRIEQGQDKYEVANRLSLMYLAHDIEVAKGREWSLLAGQSKQYAAVMWVAEHLNMAPDDVKIEWRRSQNYTKLFELCGPGVFLELGTGVNWCWEKALAKDDVVAVIDFRHDFLPDLEARSRSLNSIAGQILCNGMLAYGWTIQELRNSSSRLQAALTKWCPELLRSEPSSVYEPPATRHPAALECQYNAEFQLPPVLGNTIDTASYQPMHQSSTHTDSYNLMATLEPLIQQQSQPFSTFAPNFAAGNSVVPSLSKMDWAADFDMALYDDGSIPP